MRVEGAPRAGTLKVTAKGLLVVGAIAAQVGDIEASAQTQPELHQVKDKLVKDKLVLRARNGTRAQQ